MGITKKAGIILFFIALVFTMWYCQSEEGGSYCYGCKTTEPDTAELIIQLTINKENPAVPVKIYSGKYNYDHPTVPIHIDTIKNEEYKIFVPTNNTYSAVAEYKAGSRTINAVDGSVFNREEQTGCEITCWQLYGGELDVRLKDY